MMPNYQAKKTEDPTRKLLGDFLGESCSVSSSEGLPPPPAMSFQVSCTMAAASAMTRATSFAAAMTEQLRVAEANGLVFDSRFDQLSC